MHIHFRISINVILFIIANVVSEADDEDTTVNPGSDIFGTAALDLSNEGSTFHPDYDVALDNVALGNGASDINAPPGKEDLGSVESLNPLNPLIPDTSSGAGGSIAVSDSNNCAGNLGKREDSDGTLGHYSSLPRTLFSLDSSTEMSPLKSVKPVFPECPSPSPSILQTLCKSFKAYPQNFGNMSRTG